MSEINQVEVLIKPQVPKVIDNQQLLVYIPTATITSVSNDFEIDYGQLKLNVGLERGTGINAVQMRADESKSGHLTFPDDTIYAKKLDPTLSLDSEPIGALGDYSATFGGNGQSKGKRTFTAGTTVLAKANYSAAFGDNSVTLIHGTDGMAQGYQTVIDAPASHSEGAYTVVMNQKYVEGMFDPDAEPGQPGQPVEPGTTPTDTLQMDNRRGEAGHADGFNSYVSGFAAHTDGVSNVADGHISKASGRSNRAWSYLSKVDGYQSVVKPDDADADATGEGSWANGYDIQLVGAKYAYAGGAHGRGLKGADYSFSYGLGLTALGKAQAVFGQYNNGDDDSVFIVGNGISDTQRSTAFQVLKNGQVIVNSAPVNGQGVVRLVEYNVLDSKIISNSTEITNLWNTIRETNNNLVRVDNNSYKKTGGAITGNVQVTGSLQVQIAPTNPNDVVRLQDISGISGGIAVILSDPSTAVKGTLTTDQLTILQASNNNYIVFNNELYYLADKQHTTGILSYTHTGWDGSAVMTKSINITISTKAWALVTGSSGGDIDAATLAGLLYADDGIGIVYAESIDKVAITADPTSSGWLCNKLGARVGMSALNNVSSISFYYNPNPVIEWQTTASGKKLTTYYKFPEKYTGTKTLLTNDYIKTLFGNKTLVGEGNIDLYRHVIRFQTQSAEYSSGIYAYAVVISSNNLVVDSITDLKTLMGKDTFEYPLMGICSQNSTSSSATFVATKVTESKLYYWASGSEIDSSISLAGVTITDTVATV